MSNVYVITGLEGAKSMLNGKRFIFESLSTRPGYNIGRVIKPNGKKSATLVSIHDENLIQ